MHEVAGGNMLKLGGRIKLRSLFSAKGTHID